MKSDITWDKEFDATIYAYWVPLSCTVTFNKNGGSGGTNSVLVEFGKPMPSIKEPVLEGFEFKGYYSLIEGGVQYYTWGGQSARNCDFYENTVLYARWEKISWHISVIVSHSNRNYQQMYDGFMVYYGEQRIILFLNYLDIVLYLGNFIVIIQ